MIIKKKKVSKKPVRVIKSQKKVLVVRKKIKKQKKTKKAKKIIIKKIVKSHKIKVKLHSESKIQAGRRAKNANSPKVKLSKKIKHFKSVKSLIKKIVSKNSPLIKLKKARKKQAKKIHPVKYRKAVILPKAKLFNRVKKPKTQELKNSFSAGSFFKAKIKVIGIGGGGGSIVSEIGRSLNKATFVIADTDMRAFKKRAGIKYFLFGQDLTHGLGTGVNPDLGKMAAMQEKEKIARFFDDQDIVIFIASLGGGLGSGATQVFADATKNFNGITFGIFTLPFKFEGKNKYKIAVKALRELRKSLNVSITIPNERIFKIIDSNTAITDAFSIVNKNLIESLESIIDLIYSPGIINIDFADLKTILKGRGNLAFLNTAESSGKNRAIDIAQKILRNPLYQNNNFTAEKILFNISGGGNLSMFEVDKISRTISDLNPKAKIIFGVSKNSKYKNKIKTTLLMAGPSIVAEAKNPKLKISRAKISLVQSKRKSILKKGIKKQKKHIIDNIKKEKNEEKIPFVDTLTPVFNNIPFGNQSAELGLKKLSITEVSKRRKKAIRRTGLEIKKAEEAEENKQSMQEKEWEIPTFLRKVKFKS